MSVTVLVVLYCLVVVGGVTAAAAACLIDRRPRLDVARLEIGSGFDRTDTALLTGGVVRAVDAMVVDLASRGLVLADEGRLAVPPEVGHMLVTPMDSPAYAPSWDLDEAMVLVSVRTAGADGLDAVRRHAMTFTWRRRLAGLVRRGLLVTPLRQKWGPMTVAWPTLFGVFVCSMAMLGTGSIEEVQSGPAGLMIALWLPSTIAPAAIWSRRAGYRGPDPRTALGRDVSAVLWSELDPDAAQARRVAAGGLSAMTDVALRHAIQGRAVDSRWSVPTGRRAGSDHGINAVLAVEAGLGGDGDAGGGDGGDGGGD